MFEALKKFFAPKLPLTPSFDEVSGLETPAVDPLDRSGVDPLDRSVAGSTEPENAAGAANSIPADLPGATAAELRLEALFNHAAHESSKRDAFLNALMAAELIVVGQSEPADNGAVNIHLATQMASNEPVALAFTSFAAMALAGAPANQPTVRIKTLDLLRMIRSQIGFVLNPGNRVAKHFNKWEVEQLSAAVGAAPAAGSAGVREMPMPQDQQVAIGQPAAYPPGLRETLAAGRARHADAVAIHTGLMSTSEAQPPIMLAVITTSRELNREEFLVIVNDLGAEVSKLGPIPLNFAPMTPNFRELIEKRALVDVSEMLS